MDYSFGVVKISEAATLEKDNFPTYIGRRHEEQTIDNLPEYVLFFFTGHNRFGVAKVEVTAKNVYEGMCTKPDIQCKPVYCFGDKTLLEFLENNGMKEQKIIVLKAAAILAAMVASNAAAILAEMAADKAAAILEAMDAGKAAAILAAMDAGKAAEILAAMAADKINEIMPKISGDSLSKIFKHVCENPEVRSKLVSAMSPKITANENQSANELFDQAKKSDAVKDIRDIEAILNALQFKRQIVLQGPPGTGKSYTAKKIAQALTGKSEKELDSENAEWQMVQFHPSYNYEDFVRGIQVTAEKSNGNEAEASGHVQYQTKDRVFAEMCKAAQENPSQAYVLIIDEMNRANLPAVLGELIYGLEYRGEEVQTPYKVDDSNALVVPENLFVIGTMNTADRSIGHIDYAIRRRFAFIDELPDENVIVDGDAKKYFGKVANLFDTCLNGEYTKEHVQIGHSYFMASSKDELDLKMQYEVLPILREYAQDGILDDSKSPDGSESKLEDILATWDVFKTFLPPKETENQSPE